MIIASNYYQSYVVGQLPGYEVKSSKEVKDFTTLSYSVWTSFSSVDTCDSRAEADDLQELPIELNDI